MGSQCYLTPDTSEHIAPMLMMARQEKAVMFGNRANNFRKNRFVKQKLQVVMILHILVHNVTPHKVH